MQLLFLSHLFLKSVSYVLRKIIFLADNIVNAVAKGCALSLNVIPTLYESEAGWAFESFC